MSQDNELNIKAKVNVTNGVSYHNKLKNLDYKNSGHTGFASQEELNEIKNKLFILEEEIRQLKQKISQE